MQPKKENRIYIIIVSYNGMKWLPKCLESTKPYPVIVIDNSSTDGTPEYIRSNHPEVMLLKQEENLGFGRANNIGISYALKNEADFVFLLNQDAYLEPGTINNLHKVSVKNPDYGILSPIHLNGTGTELEKIFSYYLKRTDKLWNDLMLNKQKKEIYSLEMVNAAAWLISRKTLETVGGFHPMFFLYGEDDNYCQRVLYNGFKIGICPAAFVCHDSTINYHTQKSNGSKEYYIKFLNQVRVKYANVNSEEYKEVNILKKTYISRIIKSLMKFQFDKAGINWQKFKLIKNLNFSNDIEKGRKINRNYLEK